MAPCSLSLHTGRAARPSAVARSSPPILGSGASRRALVVRATTENTTTDAETMDKNLELMRHFSEQYAQRTGTYFCVDKSVTAVVIQGLAEHKASLGAPLCPCRHYDDKAAEAANGFWNCPCVPMRERKECHCMLFLTEDNDFAGREQHITHEEIVDGISHMH